MGKGLLPAQEIAEWVRSGRISFPNSPVKKEDANPFKTPLRQSDVKKLPKPWCYIDACTMQLPGTDRVYIATDARQPFEGESLEDFLMGTSEAPAARRHGSEGFYLAPNQTYNIVCEPDINIEGYTGIVTNPSSLARATLLVNGIAPCPTIQHPGYNVIKAGFRGKIVAQVRMHEHGFIYNPGDPIAQMRFATHPDQSTYTLNYTALQALAYALAERGLVNDENGKKIPFEDLHVDETGKIPIGGDFGKNAQILRARSSSKSALALGKPKDPAEFFERLESTKADLNDEHPLLNHYQLDVPEDSFLIFHTSRRILVPPWLAGSLTEYDPRYTRGGVHRNADFINPGHGWNQAADKGYGGKITLEYDTERQRTTLRDNQPLIGLTYLLLTEPSTISYDGENNAVGALLPGKLFNPWK